MSLKKLHDALFFISTGQKTGNMVIIAKEGFDKYAGTCTFNTGKLVQATFQQQTGRAALSALLALDIHDVRFMEFSVTATAHSDIPTIADLMQQVEAKNHAQAQVQAREALSSNLQDEVVRLLEKCFGASAASKVSTVAQKISPIEKPIAFLDKCRSLVEITLGKAKAEKMFVEIYEKLGDR